MLELTEQFRIVSMDEKTNVNSSICIKCIFIRSVNVPIRWAKLGGGAKWHNGSTETNIRFSNEKSCGY